MSVNHEEELVGLARDGDHRAFEELVRRTYTDTYTLAYRITGDEEDASDVVQETYQRPHKGLKKFRGHAQISTRLHRITANCANTQLGRKIRHRTDPLPDEAPIADESPLRDPAHRAEVAGLRND